MAEPPVQRSGWRGYLATSVWPWVVLAWIVPLLLLRLRHLIPSLDQDWLRWLLVAVWAIAPVATWWVRGRGREPFMGFLTLFWLLVTIFGTLEEFKDLKIRNEITGLSVQLLVIIYWSSWLWLYKLRQLPSAKIEEADKLSILIFLLTAPFGIAASWGDRTQ